MNFLEVRDQDKLAYQTLPNSAAVETFSIQTWNSDLRKHV